MKKNIRDINVISTFISLRKWMVLPVKTLKKPKLQRR